MKSKKLKKAIFATSLLSVLSLTALTGCNYTLVDFKYNFNKAIIFGDDSATIIEIDSWKDYDGEQLQIVTKDGLVIITSSFDTKLINDEDSDIKAEDVARSVLGEDATINYLDDQKQLTLTP